MTDTDFIDAEISEFHSLSYVFILQEVIFLESLLHIDAPTRSFPSLWSALKIRDKKIPLLFLGNHQVIDVYCEHGDGKINTKKEIIKAY